MKKHNRLNSMLRVDFRRMFTSSMLHILCGAALVMPILILVMTSMVAGSTVTDPQTGAVTTMEAFTSTWQIIGSSGGMMAMDMTANDAPALLPVGQAPAAPPESYGFQGGLVTPAAGSGVTALCNINLIFFMAGVYVCLFIAEDFRSGYAKNLFAVRSKKRDYVVSKTLAGFTAGALMLVCFFIGAVLGGAFAGLPFTLGAGGVFGLVMCMLAKIFLMGVFVAIAVAVSCFAKSRSWLSIMLFAFAGMLLFMMIPMMTPLDAGIMHVGLCLAGSAMFGVGLGAVSNILLSRRDLV